MSRPSLIVQTVCFDESDRESAARLGADLYGHLTRAPQDPLAHGPGIPVLSAVTPENVDLEAAQALVILPVLGKETFLVAREGVLAKLREWHEALGPGHVLPVPTTTSWRESEDDLLGKNLLTELYGAGDRRKRTLDEIFIATARLLDDGGDARLGVRLFVSHAKADLASTQEAATKIHAYVVTDTTGSAFLDVVDLHPGHSLGDELAGALERGVFVAVRGDAYSSRAWCQMEVLRAKQNGLPTLSVEVLHEGEARSGPYAGNGPSLVWDGGPEPVVRRALVEWLRAAFFRREGRRVSAAARLPADTVVLCRPPELLDLAQGPLDPRRAQVALHPDPELAVVEREVLRTAAPRLRVVTPTTAFRAALGRGLAAPDGGDRRSGARENPLDGLQVALSLSDSPDADGPRGFTARHVTDATVYLARCLVSAGASIAYGGDLRRSGYTELLSDLISAYNQTAADRSELLHGYLAASIDLAEASDDLKLTAHHLGRGDLRARALLPPPAQEPHPAALYFSDMRRVMAEETAARVLLGGAAVPRLEEGGPGYGGRYPGVAEEAWRTLLAGRPLYVAGGFGGAAELVARLLAGEPTPERLRDATWMVHERFRATAAAIDADPRRSELGLPDTMDELADAIRAQGRELLASDEAARAWNGLDVEQNRTLFGTRDPVQIAALVVEGLVELARRSAEGQLAVELVHGDLGDGRDLDALAVATFDGLPLGGAAAALDRELAGRASLARAEGHSLVDIASDELAADWLHLASLGALDDLATLPERVTAAARQTAELARRHGFTRLGLVTFGGSVLEDVGILAGAMRDGLAELAGRATLVWFETSAERFEALRALLEADEQVSLTTRRAAIAPTRRSGPGADREAELILQVRLEGDELSTTTLPPAGTGIARTRRVPTGVEQLDALARGSGSSGRKTPELAVLAERGKELAALLFGDDAPELLARCRDDKVVVIHDVPSSRLPFELLLAEPPQAEPVRPATRGGIHRRLAVAGVALEKLLAPPPRAGKLRVLLVVNPTGDLAGTEEEGEAVALALRSQGHVALTTLRREQATKAALLEALAQADVLHYSGHAFFSGPGATDSGLIVADGRLTLSDLGGRQLPVRLAFVNACEAARVRGAVASEAAAFAEMFLRSGIEAYLGTYWTVGDAAAASFAARVYGDLAAGETLDAAVRRGRAALFEGGQRDWANYLLYGDGRFRLVR